MHPILSKAKTRFVMRHRSFAPTVLKFEYVEDEKIGTMAVTRKQIIYAPKFIDTLSIGECVGLLAHETLHYLYLHHIRGKNKHPEVWNEACDYVINQDLLKEKFELPKGYLYDSRFKGLTAEQVYNTLMKEGRDKSVQPGGPGDWGKVLPPKKEQEEQAEAEAKKDLAEVLTLAGGEMSDNLESVLTKLLEPKRDWREVLLRYLAERARNDYNWETPDQSYLQRGIYIPGLESIELGKVIFIIDSSSSMDEDALEQAAAELKEASKLFNFPVTVLYVDTEVRDVVELDEETKLTVKGRGGTKFQPAFDWVEENASDAKAIIYFTDGDCWDTPKEPSIDVLWILYNNTNFKIKFGEVVNFT